MRMKRHQEETHESTTGIDLAPMLDFVVNLLIFFIITAVFVKEVALEVNRPQGEMTTDSSPENASIPISILADGSIWVDNREVDNRAVRANVERLHAVKPKAGVLIIADQSAPHGTVIDVVDAARLAQVDNITFTTGQ
ncbi:MAG: biopolymer transporter ExbD [Deltaproteobacteria bacterium]|nr:biopolymer transporter ExbD [Deltaproteobacteria bacterium]